MATTSSALPGPSSAFFSPMASPSSAFPPRFSRSKSASTSFPHRKSTSPSPLCHTVIAATPSSATEGSKQSKEELPPDDASTPEERRARLVKSAPNSPTFKPVVRPTLSTSNIPALSTTAATPTRADPPPKPHFPHSRPLRPLTLSTLTPHAGQSRRGTALQQKVIVPTMGWKGCFELNLTQAELARVE